jgi:anti-anti-sigma factor
VKAFLAHRPGSLPQHQLRVAAPFDRLSSIERACALHDEHPVLEIIEAPDAERTRVRLRGELDLATAPVLSEALRRLQGSREPVVLDLDELAFIDMSGLRVVLAAAGEALGEPGAFSVTRGSPQVRRLVELVQIDGQLPREGSSE